MSGKSDNTQQIAQYLIDQGINVNLQDEHDDTALHSATLIASIDDERVTSKIKAIASSIATIIINNTEKAYLALRNEYGWTPLHIALMGENTELTTLLIKQTSNINTQDEKGNTGLHYLALTDGIANEQKEVLNLLNLMLDNGADLNILNKNGNTPFGLIITQCKDLHYKTLKELTNKGVKLVVGQKNLAAVYDKCKKKGINEKLINNSCVNQKLPEELLQDLRRTKYKQDLQSFSNDDLKKNLQRQYDQYIREQLERKDTPDEPCGDQDPSKSVEEVSGLSRADFKSAADTLARTLKF